MFVQFAAPDGIYFQVSFCLNLPNRVHDHMYVRVGFIEHGSMSVSEKLIPGEKRIIRKSSSGLHKMHYLSIEHNTSSLLMIIRSRRVIFVNHC